MKKKTKNILIINYNTTLLTQCCIKSIIKTTPGTHIYVFDNSDVEPFENIFKNVTVFDNTKGQIINFDEWIANYPKARERACNFGTAKHTISVDIAMNLINEPFILLDSDVLVKKDLSDLYQYEYTYVGEESGEGLKMRVVPYVCFINTPLCKEHGITYFNENYILGLNKTDINKNSGLYDTGSAFFFQAKLFPHKNIKVNDYVIHFGHGSWMNKKDAYSWVAWNKNLWDDNKNSSKEIVEELETIVTEDYISGGQPSEFPVIRSNVVHSLSLRLGKERLRPVKYRNKSL